MPPVICELKFVSVLPNSSVSSVGSFTSAARPANVVPAGRKYVTLFSLMRSSDAK